MSTTKRGRRPLGRPPVFSEKAQSLGVRLRTGLRERYRLYAALDRTTLNGVFAHALEAFMKAEPYKRGHPFVKPSAAPRGPHKGEWEQVLMLLPPSLIRLIRAHATIAGVSVAAFVATATEWDDYRRAQRLGRTVPLPKRRKT